jgi:hypothetical protein
MDTPAARPALIVTVDVEGDDVWTRRPNDQVTLANLRELPRLHALCAEFSIPPVYLTSAETLASASYRRFLRLVLDAREAELGMHLHAWNSPPHDASDADAWRRQPLLTEYPAAMIHAKVRHLTDALGNAFGVAPRAHRGGRWAMDTTYARALVEHGYVVDSSVTPGLTWRGAHEPSAPDYTGFPVDAYVMDLARISEPGASALLEVPLTTHVTAFGRTLADGRSAGVVEWLRPTARNGPSLRRVADAAITEGRSCLVVMLHSSDLLPGGSPVARDRDAVERVLGDLRHLFGHVRDTTQPMTLSAFHAHRVGLGAH